MIPEEFAGIAIVINGNPPGPIGSLTSYADINHTGMGTLQISGTAPSVLHGNYQLGEDASIQNNNTLTFNANFFYRGLIFGSPGSVVFGPSSFVDMANVTIRQPTSNFGVVNLLGDLELGSQSGVPAVFTNEVGGFFSHETASDIYGNGLQAFINNGDFAVNHGGVTDIELLDSFVQGSTGRTYVNDGVLLIAGNLYSASLAGLLEIAAGAEFVCRAEDTYYNDGLLITGDGTLTFDLSIDHFIGGGVLWSPAVVSISGFVYFDPDATLTINSPDFAVDAEFSGPGTLTIAADTNAYMPVARFDVNVFNFGAIEAEGGVEVFGEHDFVNHGTVVVSSGLSIDASARFINRGGLTFSAQISPNHYLFVSGEFVNQTDGDILIEDSAQVYWEGYLGGAFTNNGSIIVGSGSLLEFLLANVVIGPASALSGPGSFALVGYNDGENIIGTAVTFPANTFGLAGAVGVGVNCSVTLEGDVVFGESVVIEGGGSLLGAGNLTFGGGLITESNAGAGAWAAIGGSGTATIPTGQTAVLAGTIIARAFNVFGELLIANAPADNPVAVRVQDGATLAIRTGAVLSWEGDFDIVAWDCYASWDQAVLSWEGEFDIVILSSSTLLNEGQINKISSTLVSVLGTGGIINAAGATISIAGGDLALAASGGSANNGSITIAPGSQLTLAAQVSHGGLAAISGQGSLYIIGSTQFFGAQLQHTGSTTIAGAMLTFNAATVFAGPVAVSASHISGPANLTFNGGLSSTNDTWNGSGLLTIPVGAAATMSGPVLVSRTLNNLGTLFVTSGTVIIEAFTSVSGTTLTGGAWVISGTLILPVGTPNLTTIGAAARIELRGPGATFGGVLGLLAVNIGTLTLHDGAPWAFNPVGGVFTNNGTFNITGVGTITVPAHVTFNNGAAGVLGGTLNIGDPMRGPGPTIEFGPFDGGGVININATVAFNQDFEIFAVVNLFIPGTLTGTGNILVSGTFNWYGGAQRGTGSTSVGSGTTLNMFGDGVMTLARSMTNLVAGNWTGGCLLLEGGQFANAAGATFTINGQVEVLSTEQGGESFSNEGELVIAPGSDVTFGTGLAVSNTGVLVIESYSFFADDQTFDGTVELAPGGEIDGPGNITFLFGFIWTGGAMSGSGVTTIAADALLLMGDGNMTLSRRLENFSVAGSWTGGCLLMAGGVFNNNAGASLDVFADPQIDVLDVSGENAFNNHGLITVWTGEFIIGVPGTNSGTIIVIPPDTLVFLAPWTYLPGSSLEGPGGVRFGGGLHSFPTGAFSITGPVGLLPGATLVLPASSLPNYNPATNTFSGGEWTIGAGASLFLNGADIRVIGAGTTFRLIGNGQLDALANLSRIDGTLVLEDGAALDVNPDAANGALLNNGHLRIGPGSLLSIAGSYLQSATASLHVGVAGTNTAQMGRMLATGGAALNGSFELTYENGFAAARGQEFRVLSSAGTTGAFSSIAAPPPPGSNLKSPVLADALGVRHLVTHVADWNNDLVVNVPDIFDFLTDWFAGRADFDGLNGTDVPDIFAFLAAWFSA